MNNYIWYDEWNLYTPLYILFNCVYFWWYYLFLDNKDVMEDLFWDNLNYGWKYMKYVNTFENFWGIGSYPPERIVLSPEDFDSLLERINSPPDPEAVESLKKLMSRVAPWDNVDDFPKPNDALIEAKRLHELNVESR